MIRHDRVWDLEADESKAVIREDAVDPHPRAPLVRREGVAEPPARLHERVLVAREVAPEGAAQTRQVGIARDDDRSGLAGRGLRQRLDLQVSETHVDLDDRGRRAGEQAAGADLLPEPVLSTQSVETLARRDGVDIEERDRAQRSIE